MAPTNAPLLIISIITMIIFTHASLARELRPAYHGLDYQNSDSSDNSAAMLSFFGASPPPTSTSSSSGMALPKALNSSAATLPRGDGDGCSVKEVLFVASLACGVVGLVLLLASGVILLTIRFQNGRQMACSNDNGNTK